MADVKQETLDAVREELNLLRKAIQDMPELPVGSLHECGCVGPLPECRCAKRARLIDEFLSDE